MRAIVLAALCATLVGTAWMEGRGGGSSPELRVVARVPFTVAGTGFEARESVRLTLRAGRSRPAERDTRADEDGRFRAAFAALVLVEPCTGQLVVTANGSRGSRATWKRACRPPSTRPPRVTG